MMLEPTFKNSNQAQTMAIIINSVCEFYGVEKQRVISPTRQREYAEPRQISMYIAKKLTAYSLASIGSYFVGLHGKKKDHATVLHAKRAMQNLIDTDKDKEREINFILNRVESILEGTKKNNINDQTIIIDSRLGKFITFIGFSQEEINKIQEVFRD